MLNVVSTYQFSSISQKPPSVCANKIFCPEYVSSLSSPGITSDSPALYCQLTLKDQLISALLSFLRCCTDIHSCAAHMSPRGLNTAFGKTTLKPAAILPIHPQNFYLLNSSVNKNTAYHSTLPRHFPFISNYFHTFQSYFQNKQHIP